MIFEMANQVGPTHAYLTHFSFGTACRFDELLKIKLKICVPAFESLENCEVGGFKTKKQRKIVTGWRGNDEGIKN